MRDKEKELEEILREIEPKIIDDLCLNVAVIASCFDEKTIVSKAGKDTRDIRDKLKMVEKLITELPRRKGKIRGNDLENLYKLGYFIGWLHLMLLTKPVGRPKKDPYPKKLIPILEECVDLKDPEKSISSMAKRVENAVKRKVELKVAGFDQKDIQDKRTYERMVNNYRLAKLTELFTDLTE